jgi:hypothetical protein
MTREQLDALWAERRNWKWGVYYCKEDPRVVVPKRARWMGWTINFARPTAVPVLVLFLGILIIPLVVAKWAGMKDQGILIVAAMAIVALWMTCVYMASRRI